MSPRLKKVLRYTVIGAIVVAVGIQLVPVKGIASNPPERFPLGAPPEVEAIMRRACFDCHTNETRWPLYSRLAPGSWLMARDVTNGRSHFNLSEWGNTDEEERQLDRENAWDQIEAGEMPPWFYIYPLHLNARLSDAEKATLKAWLLKDKGKKPDKEKENETDTVPGGADGGRDGGRNGGRDGGSQETNDRAGAR